MQTLFGHFAPFWRDHRYNEIEGCAEVGYFSYVSTLTGEPEMGLDSAIRHIQKAASGVFPKAKDAAIAEWWAHCRPHATGHQLHYDSANEGINGVQNPICSVVVVLEAGEGTSPEDEPTCGGPTLLCKQRLNEEFHNEGWLAFPRVNRMVVFDGKHLHGVIPGYGSGKKGRRVTWMVSFWEKPIDIHPWDEKTMAPGAARPMLSSQPSEEKYRWLQNIGSPRSFDSTELKPVTLQFIPAVWQSIDGDAVMELPPYAECLQV